MLKLMYITNDIEIAQIAQSVGVDRIFIDMEVLGKVERQGHLDSVKSHHTLNDILKIRPILDSSELLVRVNPINVDSRTEINAVIQSGADIIMLPMYKTVSEVEQFIDIIGGRTKVMLLLETKEAHSILDETLKIPGIDEIHIGLNDLHLSYHKKFMFELLADGTVEDICKRIAKTDIVYGFGGVAALGTGIVPAEEILCEHYYLGSQMVILSRSFCDLREEHDLLHIKEKFSNGVMALRNYERQLMEYTDVDFVCNYKMLTDHIGQIVSGL